MADPVLTISAASGVGRNFATFNGTITPNSTNRAWRDGTQSDTDYFWQFCDANGKPLGGAESIENTSPFDLFAAEQTAYVNTDMFGLVTAPRQVTGSSPIALADVAYMLIPGVTYYVQLWARRFQWSGGLPVDDLRGDRASQPYKLFVTASVSFTCA